MVFFFGPVIGRTFYISRIQNDLNFFHSILFKKMCIFVGFLKQQFSFRQKESFLQSLLKLLYILQEDRTKNYYN